MSADNDKANSNPWYLQYFGYSPSSAKPAGYQETQDASAALKHSQPEGVEWLWLSVAGTFSNEGEDDTEESKPPNGSKDSPNLVSKITAAEPGELTRILYQAYDPGPPSKRCGSMVRCNLEDTTGRYMPGVLCQERFPEPGEMPPNVQTNTEDQAWFTAVVEGTGLPNGNWDRYDGLRYVWPPSPPFQSYDFPQQYWVATKSLTSGGILKRSWTITLTPGQPGTLSQDEN